jgi:phage terminase large subunit
MTVAAFPEVLSFLFDPMRFKVAYGGRGSAKSWSFARALLLQAAAEPLRVLCTREVQRSIKDSVHTLLKDQVESLGLGNIYEVLEHEIRCINGSRFIFSGLSQQTVESIKSFEGVDRVWCEEAQAITKRSWDVLIPTIRRPGSEIWVSYNPELDTDETHQRFVVNPPEDCISAKVNYSDNPWFPPVLEKERLRCKIVDPQGYENIWEGHCKPAVVGAIYYNEVARAEAEKQICNVPYDPMLKVHVVFDLGWNDAMAISLVQKLRSEIRIIEYIEDSHKTLDIYSAMLKDKRYNWGKVFLPHDGAHKDFKTGRSSVQMMVAWGWDVELIENISVEAGIKALRMCFGQIFFDKRKTERLIQCLKRYRRAINQQTNEAGGPLHDEWSHGADNARYIAICADKMTNEDWTEPYEEHDESRSMVGGY